MISFQNITEITGGTVLCHANPAPVAFLITDSRKAIYHHTSMFFGIRGRYVDGHDFIAELYKKGIRQFLVERKDIDIGSYPGSNFLKVESSVMALQQITAFHRSKHNLKVIGITGSNGKTIVKEWLSQLLSWKYNVIRSPKSFNSQIGVPLSVWQINENHEYGIFEAGLSKPGEMENLFNVLKPEFGIFTNIGPAHDEGFQSREQKIIEKLKLFRSVQLLVVCSDYQNVIELAGKELPGIKLFTWGTGHSDVNVSFLAISPGKTEIDCIYRNEKFRFTFQFSDKASLENIMHCIALLLYFNWDPLLIQQGIHELSKVSMRLELKRGINNCYIIDDSYNNDLISLEIGLNFMAHQSNNDKKTLILSDILQSGLPADVLYGKTAQLIDQYDIQKVIGIGNSIINLKRFVKSEFSYFPDAGQFLKKFRPDNFQNEVILVKGARPFALEKIIQAFQEKIHGTVLEIDLDAVLHNFNYFRARLNHGTKIMVMVKALAYGNGSLEIANLMQYHLADYLGVAYTDEGVLLRKNGIGMPIMIMNPTRESFEKILEFRLEPEIYSLSLLKQLIDFMGGKKERVNVHLKLDTGMHRLGLSLEDVPDLVALIGNNKNISVKSVFSHFAAADDVELDEFTRLQAESFLSICHILESGLKAKFIRHMANSAAILRFPEYHYDMVRLGIGLYGLGPGNTDHGPLRPVSTLKTIISQIKTIAPGESVGYGRKGKVNRLSKIATIAIGYADGFSRAFSNGIGHVWVNNTLVPVIGNVCMDMTMIDVTGIEVNEGDEVIIFGKENSIHDLAESIHTIPYEIITSISDRVKRIYYKD